MVMNEDAGKTNLTVGFSISKFMQKKIAIWRFSLFVAGARIELASGGYEPPEIPFLHPAMKKSIAEDSIFATD